MCGDDLTVDGAGDLQTDPPGRCHSDGSYTGISCQPIFASPSGAQKRIQKPRCETASSSGAPQGRTKSTSTVRGPCTPLTLVISMSTVPEGPENRVIGFPLIAISSRMPSGTVSRIWSCRTTHR